ENHYFEAAYNQSVELNFGFLSSGVRVSKLRINNLIAFLYHTSKALYNQIKSHFISCAGASAVRIKELDFVLSFTTSLILLDTAGSFSRLFQQLHIGGVRHEGGKAAPVNNFIKEHMNIYITNHMVDGVFLAFGLAVLPLEGPQIMGKILAIFLHVSMDNIAVA
ncbi:hypothetical protein ACJX0J_006155, partial [Zea mays]